MPICKLPRCKECNSIIKYRRRTDDYACTYCPKIYTKEEAAELSYKPEAVKTPKGMEPTFDIGDVRIFNQPIQAPSAAIASTPSSTYNLRDEK